MNSENFRHYNQQWIEMVTGETLQEDEDIDEDYMDYLQMAADLYSPDIVFYDPHQMKSPPIQSQALYASPIEGYDALAAYGVHGLQSPVDNDIILYNSGLYDPVVMGEVTDYSDHPALSLDPAANNELLTHQMYGGGPRPPSRLNF